MPLAARITNMHTCSMVTGLVPDVGGTDHSPLLPDRDNRWHARRLRRRYDRARRVIVTAGCPTVMIG